jgi:hypothetical protein
MRGEGSGGGHGSNPLWWILGLIALILIVSFFRKGTTAPALQQAVQRAATVYGPLQACRLELAKDSPQTDRVLPVLRAFFREQGYDTTLHESADGALVSATFSRLSSDEQLTQHALYQHIAADHKTLKPRHTLVFQVYRLGGTGAEHLEQSLEVSRQLRMRLEADLPGIVLYVDDTPRAAAYDDVE